MSRRQHWSRGGTCALGNRFRVFKLAVERNVGKAENDLSFVSGVVFWSSKTYPLGGNLQLFESQKAGKIYPFAGHSQERPRPLQAHVPAAAESGENQTLHGAGLVDR